MNDNQRNYLPFGLYCTERKLGASEIRRRDSHSGSPIVDQTYNPFRVASATESRLPGFQHIWRIPFTLTLSNTLFSHICFFIL